ncbi:MAG: four helix bundle protein [Ignavibacteria bacterium]|nr:four helix bundle protein [Ignavibacteria bacterium]
MKIMCFEDLDAWKEGRKLVNRIYGMSNRQKFSRDFSLRDQVRRAAISVTSNIAEGFDSESKAEFIRFLVYARRSTSEVKSQLYVAHDQQYITDRDFQEAYELASVVARITYGLIRVSAAGAGTAKPVIVVSEPRSALLECARRTYSITTYNIQH